MPKQLRTNQIRRTELDGLSITKLQNRIAKYGRLIHYYTAKREEAIEELDQRIWHNEEDFWGLDKEKKEDGLER